MSLGFRAGVSNDGYIQINGIDQIKIASDGSFSPLNGQLILSKTSGDPTLTLSGVSGTNRLVRGQTNGVNRWNINLGNTTAESGSNTGSDFGISRYNDAGTFIDSPIFITRSTGDVSASLTNINRTQLVINGAAINGNTSIELGYTGGAATSAFIDFHSGATATDFDVRLLSSGGNGTAGNGTLNITAVSTALTGTLTVGTGTASYIYMTDTDEGQRVLHCNSNRIGFLTQGGGWGSWCEDDGSWASVGNITATGNIVSSSNGVYGNYIRSYGSMQVDSSLQVNGNATANGASNASAFHAKSSSGLIMDTYAIDGDGANHDWSIDAGVIGVAANLEFMHKPGVYARGRIYVNGFSFDFESGGTAYCGSWVSTSDTRVKTNKVVIEGALDKVDALTGYTYDRLDMMRIDGTIPRTAGVIAQDVLEVLPEAVVIPENYDRETMTGDNLSLRNDALFGLLVNAIKELRAEVKALKESASK